MNALAEELRTDFAASGVVRFAIGFLGSKITKLHRIDPPTEDVMTTSGVILECMIAMARISDVFVRSSGAQARYLCCWRFPS
jgi:hypothetical protein